MSLRLSATLTNVLRLVPILRFDPLATRALAYATRTTFASMVALYIALAFQFDDPSWAAMTVWIVGQPMRGMTLSKSYYRFLGTVAGAIMAVVLTASFAQNGTLFMVFFAGWIALCTFVSTLLRNFKSYGTVLAGYTCGIIALGAYGKPDDVFTVAMARVSCIFLGIAVEAVIAAIFVKSTPHHALLMRLRTISSDTATVITQILADPKNVSAEKNQRILRDIAALDSAVSFASAENADIRRRAGMLRRIIIAIMTAMSSAQALGRHLLHTGSIPPSLKDDIDHATILLGKATPENGTATGVAIKDLHSALEETLQRQLAKNDLPTAREFFVRSRFSEMLGALGTALNLTKDFFAGVSTKGRVDLSIHRDYEAATINAIRAYVAVFLAWLFWYATGWTHGPNFIRMVAVVCALFATRDNPVIGSRNFFNGALVACVVAGICHIFILPGINGFELLTLLMAPVLMIGGYLMVQPKTAAIASPFNIYFISLLGISNTARYPIQNFLNDIIPLLIGTGISVVVFKVLFPIDIAERRKRIQRAVLADIGALADPRNRMPAARWYSRMADRLALLSTIRAPGGEPRLMERIIVAVEIGAQTITLRALFHNDALPAECRKALATSLAGLRLFPRLDLVPGLGSNRFSAFMPRIENRDGRWLHDHLRVEADAIEMILQKNATSFPVETQLLMLQCIAAQREIAEILATHYIGSSGPAPEAEGP